MKILFVYNHDSTWTRDDLAILRKHFEVETYFYRKDKKRKNIKKLVRNSDLLYIWFASYHALKAVWLAKKYGKKVVTVASGYSVANLPQYNYGLAAHFYTRWMPIFILKNSDIILAVSKANKREIENLVKNANIKIVYHGVDIEKFTFDENLKKRRMVITVGGLDKTSWRRKGIDKFIEVAEQFPETPFFVIGRIKENVKKYMKNLPQNLKFTGFVSDEKLVEFYQKAKVYAQFSFHEAFGCSVAESMLCGCIPVVTNMGSLPEVVGETGFVIPYWNKEKAVSAVKEALNASDEAGKKARERVINNFALTKREKRLVEEIRSLEIT